MMALIPLFGTVQQLYFGIPFGNNPVSDFALILITIGLYIFLSLFFIIRLETIINEAGILVKFFPIITKKLNWEDIKSLKVIDYGFIGGWGIRLWTAYGTVYNIKGKMGLLVELKNGKTLVIGTQKPKEIEAIVNTYFNKES
ncbi:MAG: hypothetical protein AB7O73_15795 [Bacteroidia bacterium]